MDTRPRTSLISFCTVQLRTLCPAHSLATLYPCTTSGPDPGELPGFWGSMVFRHAPIPRKGSGNQQQQQTKPASTASADHSILLDVSTSLLKNIFLQMMYSMTNPFLSGYLSILFILSLLWFFVLTLWNFYGFLRYIRAAFHRTFHAQTDD